MVYVGKCTVERERERERERKSRMSSWLEFLAPQTTLYG
jgi:hypothetical protein